MVTPIACVAPGRRHARTAAAAIAARSRDARLEPFSLAEYVASPASPGRVVLCPAGLSLADDLRFLERAAGRLLWPAPPAGFRHAIGGLRADEKPRQPAGGSSRRAARRGSLAAALLLEGPVGPGRARDALASSAPREWIVESPRHVRVSARLLSALAHAGVRWSALEPVELVALYATPALARARARWKKLLPPRTPVWMRRR